MDLKHIVDAIAGLNRVAHEAATPSTRRTLFSAKAALLNELATTEAELEVRLARPGLLFIRILESGRGWHLPISFSSQTLREKMRS